LPYFSIADGQVESIDGDLSKSMLENNKCYLLDCGSEIFIWVGRVTQVEERKTAIQAAEVKLESSNLLSLRISEDWFSFLPSSTGFCC